MKARNHARQRRGRPTHDYWLAYHACHAAIYRVVARRGSDHGYAAVPGGDFIETCPQCGRLLVAADVRRWHELSQHPGGVGRALREWSRERKKREKGQQMQTNLVLILDSELLALAGDAVVLPDLVQVEERGDLGLTVLHAAFPAEWETRTDLTGLRSRLAELQILAESRWMTPADAERLLQRYQPVVYRYIVTKRDDQVADYLNFGAAFAGPVVGRYRVVRVPEEHATWLHTRLATGWQLGCSELFARYEGALSVIEGLNKQHKGGQQ